MVRHDNADESLFILHNLAQFRGFRWHSPEGEQLRVFRQAVWNASTIGDHGHGMFCSQWAVCWVTAYHALFSRFATFLHQGQGLASRVLESCIM